MLRKLVQHGRDMADERNGDCAIVVHFLRLNIDLYELDVTRPARSMSKVEDPVESKQHRAGALELFRYKQRTDNMNAKSHIVVSPCSNKQNNIGLLQCSRASSRRT